MTYETKISYFSVRWTAIGLINLFIFCCSFSGHSWARNGQNDLYIESVILDWPEPRESGTVPANSHLKANVVVLHQFNANPNVPDEPNEINVWVTAMQLPGGGSEVVLKHSQHIALNTTTHFSLSIPIPLGTYAMVIELDPENRVPEIDESNNRYQFLATGKSIELTREQVIEKLLEKNPIIWTDGRKHTLAFPVKADLAVSMDNSISDENLPDFFHYSIKIKNKGPDRLPEFLLNRLSVSAGFHDSKIVCTAELSAPSFKGNLSDLTVGDDMEIDMYRHSINDVGDTCRPALLPRRDDPMDEENIYFIGGEIPESSISINTKSAENILPGKFDYILVDDNQENNKKHVEQHPNP